MAKVTIVIKDDAENAVGIDLSFDPPLDHQDLDNMTPAQMLGLALMRDAHAIMGKVGAEHLETEFEYKDQEEAFPGERDVLNDIMQGGVDSE